MRLRFLGGRCNGRFVVCTRRDAASTNKECFGSLRCVLAVTRWVVNVRARHEEAETTKENDQAHACARHVHVVLVGTNQTYTHIVLVTRVSQRPGS